MLQRIPDFISFYRSERTGTSENYIHIVSEGVNKKALLEITKVHRNAYKQIAKIISKEENLGDIPFFSFACMDRMSEDIDPSDGEL